MLALDSPEWGKIPSSPGGTGALTARLLCQVRDGDESAYLELYHQVCHQFTVGAVAYVAVPHLVQIARGTEPRGRVQPLTIVGTVAVARAAHTKHAAPLRKEWATEYHAANAEALRLAGESLQQVGLEAGDAQDLIATVAALHGLTDLAMFLFLQGGVTEL
jgi:hypothetical protein